MQLQNKTTGILSKVTKSRKKNVIVAENMYGNTSLCIPVSKLEKIYNTSYEISKFQFQKEHKDALKISTDELDKIEQNLKNALKIDINGEAKVIVGRLIAEGLQTPNSLLQEHGYDVEVIAQEDLAAVKAVLLYYPNYLIVNSNYLLVRGGRQLLEATVQKTQEQFVGVVPGRWKWNLGNWVNRNGLATITATTSSNEERREEIPISETPQQPLPDLTELDPLKRNEMERDRRDDQHWTEMDMSKILEENRQKNLSHSIPSISNTETSDVDFDDYFN